MGGELTADKAISFARGHSSDSPATGTRQPTQYKTIDHLPDRAWFDIQQFHKPDTSPFPSTPVFPRGDDKKNQIPNMADRFPSLEEFDSGGKSLPQPRKQEATSMKQSIADRPCDAVQTEIKDVSDVPSASNFLEREKAILGEDANQFATVEDATLEDDNDLLGGGGAAPAATSATAAFESQFPDITGGGNEVCFPPTIPTKPTQRTAPTIPSPKPHTNPFSLLGCWTWRFHHRPLGDL